MSKLPKEIIELKHWAAILREVLEINKNYVCDKKDSWLVDSESLLQKEAFHALSVLYLLKGTKPSVPEIKVNINFIDYVSIYAITRSALEAYLVLYYIFLDKSAGVRVKKLRHKIWHASSLSQRQRQVVTTEKSDLVLSTERTRYLKLRREILKSKTFNSISLPQRRKLERKKSFDWKPQDGWRGIALSSDLSEHYWVDVYNLLSSVAHSNAVVSHQFASKDPKGVQESSALLATSFINFIIPLFIEGYSFLFPRVKEYLNNNESLLFEIKVAKGVVGEYGVRYF